MRAIRSPAIKNPSLKIRREPEVTVCIASEGSASGMANSRWLTEDAAECS